MQWAEPADKNHNVVPTAHQTWSATVTDPTKSGAAISGEPFFVTQQNRFADVTLESSSTDGNGNLPVRIDGYNGLSSSPDPYELRCNYDPFHVYAAGEVSVEVPAFETDSSIATVPPGSPSPGYFKVTNQAGDAMIGYYLPMSVEELYGGISYTSSISDNSGMVNYEATSIQADWVTVDANNIWDLSVAHNYHQFL